MQTAKVSPPFSDIYLSLLCAHFTMASPYRLKGMHNSDQALSKQLKRSCYSVFLNPIC